MSMHAHHFLYLGDLVTPDGAGRPVFWCSDCGTAVERFPRQVAEIVPTWAKERAAGAAIGRQDFKLAEPRWKPIQGADARLGRGLEDLKKSHSGGDALRRMIGGAR